jgi:hypothetical protein
MKNNKNTIIVFLGVGTVALLFFVFYSPIWWVALKAPQYPEAAFPDGIRIHFHVNGVFNGCTKVKSQELTEDEALNCKHEMDAINHYVGMYPIAAGAPVERAMSPFIFVLLGCMVIAFTIVNTKYRSIWLVASGTLIVIWAAYVLFMPGGAVKQSSPYLYDVQTTMDLDDKDIKGLSGLGLIKKSYAESLARYFPTVAVDCKKHIPLMKYLKLYGSQNKEFLKLNDLLSSNGVNNPALMGIFAKTYKKFKNKNDISVDKIKQHFMTSCNKFAHSDSIPDVKRVAIIKNATIIVFIALIVAVLLISIGGLKIKQIYWLLILVPMALPVFFIADYAGWLWWFGHNLSEFGAFTVKPFMPTVFGVGKVAQFATYSYPYYGFGLIMLVTIFTGIMALLRYKQQN